MQSIICDFVGLEGKKIENHYGLNKVKKSGHNLMVSMTAQVDGIKPGKMLKILSPILLDDWQDNLIDRLYVPVFSNEMKQL